MPSTTRADATAARRSLTHQVAYARLMRGTSVAVACMAGLGAGCHQNPGKPTDAGAGDADGSAIDAIDAPILLTGPITFDTGGSPEGIAAADFNADGSVDLAFATENDNGATVRLNTSTSGSESFTDPVLFPTATQALRLVAADFNGDGAPDLAVANQAPITGSTLSILLDTTGTGSTPTFADAVTVANLDRMCSIVTADFNGDGKPDLAFGSGSSTPINVILDTTMTGATAPTFSAAVPFATNAGTTAGVVAAAAGDLNSDGKPDLVTVNLDTQTISILLNTTTTGATTPTFAAHVDLAAGTNPTELAIGDLDGDGKPDIVVVDLGPSGGTETSDALLIFRNTTPTGATTPTFASPVSVTTLPHPTAVAIGDIDRDGLPDLVVVSSFAGKVSVLANQGALGFALATPDIVLVPGSSWPVLADLDGDGKLDMAIANVVTNTVSVILAE
jgi:hypothetical protein